MKMELRNSVDAVVSPTAFPNTSQAPALPAHSGVTSLMSSQVEPQMFYGLLSCTDSITQDTRRFVWAQPEVLILPRCETAMDFGRAFLLTDDLPSSYQKVRSLHPVSSHHQPLYRRRAADAPGCAVRPLTSSRLRRAV